MPAFAVVFLTRHWKSVALGVVGLMMTLLTLFGGADGSGNPVDCGGTQGLGAGWGTDTASALAPSPVGAQTTFSTWSQHTVRYQGQSETVDPVANAKAVIAAVAAKGLPGRAAVIALATAMAESSLNQYAVNGNTIGMFQQDSGYSNRTDPTASADGFLSRLVKVANWQTLPLGTVAQDVEKSAFPGRYRQFEQTAGQAVEKLTNSQVPAENTSTLTQTASCTAVAGLALTSATVPNGAFPIVTPVPTSDGKNGVIQQIGVPNWPPGIETSGRIVPSAKGNQCVQAALWTFATLHVADPAYASMPATFSGLPFAYQFYGAAKKAGWTMSDQPVAGAMVVFAQQGSDFAGHIATVVATGSKGFEVVEQNWLNFDANQSGQWGTFDLRLVSWPDPQVEGFIVAPPKVA